MSVPPWHALLIFLVAHCAFASSPAEALVGEPLDEDESLAAANTRNTLFVDSSARSHGISPYDSDPYTQEISPDFTEAELAAKLESNKIQEINELIDKVVAELNAALPVEPGEAQVGHDNHLKYTEREKIMGLLNSVQDELSIAQGARHNELERESQTGLFGSNSRSSSGGGMFGGSRSSAGGFTYSSRERWEPGHGYTYRNEWRRPRNHRWAFGHGYEDTKSVLYDMQKNSYRNGNKRSGSMFGGGSRGQTWHYGHGYEPKGGRSSRRSSSYGSSSRRSSWLGRRLL